MAPEVTTSPDSSMVIKLTLDAFTAEKLLVTKPRSLPAATFCALLIEQALDKPTTLAERTEGSEASTSSLLENTNKEKHLLTAVSDKKKRKRPAYTDDFLAFWSAYQSTTHKSNSQSKNKAFEQWKVALQEESPESLLEAAAAGRFLPTEESQDCSFCDFKRICRVQKSSWGAIDSPPASWAERHFQDDAYEALREVRALEEGL